MLRSPGVMRRAVWRVPNPLDDRFGACDGRAGAIGAGLGAR